MTLAKVWFDIFSLFKLLDEPAHLTRIISHPTMQITVVASADRKIRYFDNVTGKPYDIVLYHMSSISPKYIGAINIFRSTNAQRGGPY